MHEHPPPPPALHRRLPNPAADHAAPASHRTSSLSHHHLFGDLAPPAPPPSSHHHNHHQNGHEDPAAIARRNTVQFPQQHHPEVSSPGSKADIAFRSMSVAGHHASSAGSSDRVPPPSHSGEMVDDQSSQHTNSRNASFTREHVCLCPPDPKIPRPRNCKSLDTYSFFLSSFP
jgi:hypothetical protein